MPPGGSSLRGTAGVVFCVIRATNRAQTVQLWMLSCQKLDGPDNAPDPLSELLIEPKLCNCGCCLARSWAVSHKSTFYGDARELSDRTLVQ